MSTTAIGTLIPILRDTGDLRTGFGTKLLAAGAVGEFGPIVLMTVFLSTAQPGKELAILLAFVIVAIGAGIFAVRSAGRGWEMLDRTLHGSSQLAVRLVILMVIALVALATTLGLDLLLGGFMAGLIFRQVVGRREVEVLESKLTAVGYGFLIPFFFVFSGMTFDLDALLGSAQSLVLLPVFLALFLVVRGTPAMLLYRDVLDRRGRRALALFCAAELPLVVAITGLAVDGGQDGRRDRRLAGRRGHPLDADLPAGGAVAAPRRARRARRRRRAGAGHRARRGLVSELRHGPLRDQARLRHGLARRGARARVRRGRRRGAPPATSW